MDNLEEIRKTIDSVDEQMARLFEQRMELARRIVSYKTARGLAICDPLREQEIIQRGALHVQDREIREYYVRFQQEVMGLSRDWQRRLSRGLKVAYSGVPGAFAYIAALRLYPGAELISFHDFAEAYRACETGAADVAVLPFENSSAGEVSSVTDLMFSGSLYVNQVIQVEAEQNLLGLPGADKTKIRKVYSHPQALAQCAEYLQSHGMEPREFANTALAAKALGDETAARKYTDLQNRIADSFNKVFYDKDTKSYGDNGSNVLALYIGVPEDRYEDVRSTLREELMVKNDGHLNTGIIGTRYLFETLAMNGMGDVAYTIMNQRDFPSFGWWIEQGATTSWEQWNGSDSRNHPMFGGGLTWFSKMLAGSREARLQELHCQADSRQGPSGSQLFDTDPLRNRHLKGDSRRKCRQGRGDCAFWRYRDCLCPQEPRGRGGQSTVRRQLRHPRSRSGPSHPPAMIVR